ncbi:MAG: iron uptake porin, partial [Cyanobacteria bacterium J06635_1]
MFTGASPAGMSPLSGRLLCLLLGTTSIAAGPLMASALAEEETTAEVILESPPPLVVTDAFLAEVPGAAVSAEAPVAEVSLEDTSVEEALESFSDEPFSPNQFAAEGFAAEASSVSPESTAEHLAQVTSVSELDDVRPTDWAYTALARLVEEYGCIEGYPDRTFRGNRAMSRYEFAAGLNACLDVITFTPGYTEDLEIIQRLQEEFAVELAEVRDRLDPLEADVAELQANQFS